MFRLLSSIERTRTSGNGTKTWARLIASSFSPSSSSFLSPSSSLFDRLSDVLSPEVVEESLVTRGYAVVDNALDSETCRRLRGEIDSLQSAGLLRPNATFLIKGSNNSSEATSPSPASPPPSLSSATLLEKRGIWETDAWNDFAVRAKAPFLSSAGMEGAKSLAALLSALSPQHLSLSGPAILKVQLNDGMERGGIGGGGRNEEEEEEEKEKALSSSSREPFSSPFPSSPSLSSFPCFPLHFDSDESLDGRRVTAIFYVSERKKEKEKEEEAGGELLLWPELFRPTSPSLLPLSIPALEGRLVLFSACRMPHAVSPSRRIRHCFTVWLSEGEEERRRKKRGRAEEEKGKGGVLSSASGRRAAARVLLAPTWRRSLVAAHPPGPALDSALRTHDADTRKLAEALKEARVVAEVVGGSDGEKSWELARSDDDDSQQQPMPWF